MKKIPRIPLARRTADHLLEGIRDQRWKVRLPGIRTLAPELGVSRHTLRAAIGLLVDEGYLVAGESWESYAIRPDAPIDATRRLRVAILVHGSPENHGATATAIRDELEEAGHGVVFVSIPKEKKNKHGTGYLQKLVPAAKADRWVLLMATRENLEWFAARSIPALAVGGRGEDSPCDAVVLATERALRELVAKLAKWGHERIVLVSFSSARKPDYGPPASVFRDALAKNGITPGAYHTPDWDETPEGFHALFDALFRVTPPTALILWPPFTLFSALVRLRESGRFVPRDVSVFCVGDDPRIVWINPGMHVAHFDYDRKAIIRPISEWVTKPWVPDRRPRRYEVPFRLVPGDTLGPMKRR